MFGYVLDEVFTHHRAPVGTSRAAGAGRGRARCAARGRDRGARAARRRSGWRATRSSRACTAAAYLDELDEGGARQDRLARRRHVLSRRARGTPRARRPARSTELATRRARRASSTQGIAVVRPPGHHADARSRDGLLPAQQRRGRGGGRARGGCGARRDRRLGRPPRQRHAGHLLGRSERAVPVGAPVPVLPGHRRADGDRRRPRRSGATVNVGLPGGCGRRRLRRGVRSRVRAGARDSSRPTSILVSAGFDAFEHDPLAGDARHARGLRGDGDAGCARSPSELRGGRIVAVLEGGYDLDGLARRA